MYQIDRQLALMNFPIEAGILLWGNGVSQAMHWNVPSIYIIWMQVLTLGLKEAANSSLVGFRRLMSKLTKPKQFSSEACSSHKY
jgi:hypothetical protein